MVFKKEKRSNKKDKQKLKYNSDSNSFQTDSSAEEDYEWFYQRSHNLQMLN